MEVTTRDRSRTASAHLAVRDAAYGASMSVGGGFATVLRAVCEVARSESGALFLVGSPGDAPRIVASIGEALGKSPVRAAVAACVTPALNGAASPGVVRGGRDGVRWLVVPVTGARGSPLGAFAFVQAPGGHGWIASTIADIEAVASHLGTAIENEQLHDQLIRALDEVLTLYSAGEAISSSLDLDHVLAGIVEISRRLTGAEACFITDAAGTGDVSVLASHGASSWWEAVRTRPEVVTVLDAVRADGESRPVSTEGVAGWCVGLRVRGHVIGTLEVYASVTPDAALTAGWTNDAHLLAGLATQAAIALENAKLYQAVREKEASLQQLVERMIRAQEEDRRRVAYDIHDGLAQLMVSAHQHLQTFGIYHGNGDVRAEPSLQKGLFMLQKSIEEVRKVIAGLRPSELDDFGLVAALQLTVQNLRDEFNWRVELHDGLDGARLPASVEVTAYRIIQEALTNARRHGQATRARISVVRRGGEVGILVRDWGHGFDTGTLATRDAPGTEAGHHVGIHGMRERAHLLGGTFTVESAPGRGTTVSVTIPVDRPDGLVIRPGDGFGLARLGEAPASAGGAVVTGPRTRSSGTGGALVTSGAVRWPGSRRNAGGRIGTWSDGENVEGRGRSDGEIGADDPSNEGTMVRDGVPPEGEP
jgi:signal transduction histidine kinase